MPMPEAAMDEDRESPARQHDVGPAWQVLAMEPEADTEAMQQAADDAFGRRVLAAHGGHDAGTLFLRDPVHKSSKTTGTLIFTESSLIRLSRSEPISA
jgi:hypothetical protein